LTRLISRRAFTALLAATAGLTTIRANGQGGTRYTFAVIGTGKRTPADLEHSDVLMVSRVDASAGTMRTLSIPRDLYVDIPGPGWNKINAAFAHAVGTNPQLDWDVGDAATVATIEHNFGLEIDGVAETDMGVFSQIIDAVSGITVDNPYAIEANSYEADTGVRVTHPSGRRNHPRR
jgi:LCP family protein required for cell wall assembly